MLRRQQSRQKQGRQQQSEETVAQHFDLNARLRISWLGWAQTLRQQVDNRLLTWQLATRRAAIAAAIGLVCALYLADLTGMGMVTPDEPRYAAIGRSMASSGDWVTPRLWGDPWFEKPALLYWMTASAFKLGFNPDLAPRLPVALLSLTFLTFFWWRLRIEWSARVASCSTAMLAASAGWLAYSHVAVTDLPLAVFFSAAVMLSMPWIARQERSLLPVAAACLGFATMAKQLVPLVLFLPVLAIGWRRWRDWLRPAPLVAFAVCALPWYILCTLRNGSEAPRVLFVQQTFSRFTSAALQHVQPWWFYLPVLLLLLYPWFPLLVLFPARSPRDPRVRALTAIVAFGFVFFSASLNKLPGYLLPLMPAAFALIGIGLDRAKRPGALMVGPIALVGLLPYISRIAPAVLAHGFRSVKIPWQEPLLWLIAGGIAGGILALFGPRFTVGAAAALAGAGLLWFQVATFPEFDAAASARPLWLAGHPQCAPNLTRGLLYGLNYYAERQLPPCPPGEPNSKEPAVIRRLIE
jgi:4-amino-4-deoxy-L-arabinose transferase-like glycosyltransferase